MDKKTGTEIRLGMRLEIRWDIFPDPNNETPVVENIWWGCRLLSLEGLHKRYGFVWKVVYDRKIFNNFEYPYSEGKIVFCGEFNHFTVFLKIAGL